MKGVNNGVQKMRFHVKAINSSVIYQLTSLFSSTADILFMYKDMETSVSSPVMKSFASTFNISPL